MRRGLRAAAAGITLIAVLSTAAPALAAPNPYTAGEVCGAGYATVETKVSSFAVVHLMYNNSNGNNCVVTMKQGAAAGASTRTAAWLELRGGSFGKDDGSFEWYAGPIRFHASGVCVMFGGFTRYGGATYGGDDLAWDHCGS